MKKELQPIQPDITKPETLTAFSVELKKFIVSQNLFTNIQGRNYVNVEGWQFAGASMGIIPIVEKCELLEREGEIAYRAEVSLYNNDRKVGFAMAMCSDKESKRRGADEYVIASMAQTRAIGKAYRLLIGFLMKMAGYESTPVEEMPSDAQKGTQDASNQETGTEGQYGYCACGQAARMSSKGNVICPDWMTHKSEGKRYPILSSKKEVEFSENLDREQFDTMHQEEVTYEDIDNIR